MGGFTLVLIINFTFIKALNQEDMGKAQELLDAMFQPPVGARGTSALETFKNCVQNLVSIVHADLVGNLDQADKLVKEYSMNHELLEWLLDPAHVVALTEVCHAAVCRAYDLIAKTIVVPAKHIPTMLSASTEGRMALIHHLVVTNLTKKSAPAGASAGIATDQQVPLGFYSPAPSSVQSPSGAAPGLSPSAGHSLASPPPQEQQQPAAAAGAAPPVVGVEAGVSGFLQLFVSHVEVGGAAAELDCAPYNSAIAALHNICSLWAQSARSPRSSGCGFR